MLAAAHELEFDPGAHCYRIGGKVLPAVTRVIAPLIDYSMVNEELLALASERGSAVHKATELHDLDDLDECSLDDRLEPYLAAWKRFRAETGFVPEAIEQRLHHPLHGYAGTIDRVGTLHGRRILLDIKTVSRLSRATGVQLAAYQHLWDVRYPQRLICGRYAVQLRPDGTYRLEPYRAPDDYTTFLALLSVARWKEKNQ
jgi:hypothetical protein